MSKVNDKTQSLLSIQSIGLLGDSQILYLAPSETIFRAFRQSIEKRDGVKLVSGGVLADAISWFSNDKSILVGPAIGESAVSLALRPFLSAGIKNIAFVGYAGAISTTLKINDFVYPTSVQSGINPGQPLNIRTANMVPTKLYPPGSTIHIAPMISVSDPYSTTLENLSQWRNIGIAAVEMELYTIAKLQKSYDFILHAGILISDVFSEDATHTKQLSSNKTKTSCRKLCNNMVLALG